MIITAILLILLFGIKFKIGLNLNGRMMVASVILFDRYYVVNLNVRLVASKLYYYINNGPLKEVKKPAKVHDFHVNLHKIKLYDGNAYIELASENIIALTMLGSISNTLFDMLNSGFLFRFNSFQGDYIMHNDNLDVKVLIEFKIRFSLVIIIFSILRTLIKDKRRKYGVQSNRGAHGVNAR